MSAVPEPTKTPRCDALSDLPTRCIEMDFADYRDLARQLETDLQHLAKVAGEALSKNTQRWLNRECLCDPDRRGTHCHRCHCITLNEAALSEINRIVNQPIK